MNQIKTPPTIEEVKHSGAAFFFLVLYTASVLIRPHEMFVDTRKWIIIRLFSILCFVVILISQRPIRLQAQHWMLIALLPLIVMSGFLNGSGMNGVDAATHLLVACIVPMFLFSNGISTAERQRVIMIVCIIAGLFMVHNGHTQQITPGGYGWALYSHSVGYIDQGERRITYLGFFKDPNDIGMFLVMTIPFIMYFYYRGKFLVKLCMLTILAAFLYGIYITGSRGTALGLAGLIGVYFLVVNAGPKLILACFMLAPAVATILASLQASMDSSANNRLYAWYHGIKMLIANPVFGIGKDRFVKEHGLVAHNSFIQVASELGIPGYSLWGGALVLTMLPCYLIIRANQEKQKQLNESEAENVKNTVIEDELKINQAMFYAMFGFLITGFFISRMFTVLLFIFLGMTMASHLRLMRHSEYFKGVIEGIGSVKSMLYSWSLVVAVYLTLKVAM